MRTLVVNGYGGKLSVENGCFKLTRRSGESIRVPVVDVDEIVLVTTGVSITGKALSLAGSAGIPVILLGERGSPPMVLSPVFGTRTVDTRRAQYTAYRSIRGLEVARCLVASKIRNQARTVMLLGELLDPQAASSARSKLLEKAQDAERVGWMNGSWRDRLRHVEAEAARVYWGFLATILPGELRFEGRDPGAGDQVNVALNYMYAILYARSFHRLVLAGLDPYGGVMHADRSGRESLVYDFTDPLKPLVDFTLMRAFMGGLKLRVEGGLLDGESRVVLVKLFHSLLEKKVKLGGRTPAVLFEDATRILAFRLAKMFREGPDESFTIEWEG